MKDALGLVVLLLPMAVATAAEGQLVGVKLVKQTDGVAAARPKVTLPEGCALHRETDPSYGEKYYGENAREFFFHARLVGDVDNPRRVKVQWPGVAIARVIVGDDNIPFQATADGVEFDLPRSGGNITQVATVISDPPGMQMILMHHLEARRAGPYATGPWPEAQIRAHFNFLLASREALSLMGLLAADRGFEQKFGLYGFESNFPRGHVDHPPHFHIIFIPEKWEDVQVTHFRLDERGHIVVNDWQGHGQHRQFKPGEVCEHKLDDGRAVLQMTVTDAGGLLLTRPGLAAQYTLVPDARSGLGSTAVDVLRDGRPFLRVSAVDNAALGKMRIVVAPLAEDAPAERVEELTYDPDTGKLVQGK